MNSTLPPKRTTTQPPQRINDLTQSRFTITEGITRDGFKIGIYGPEGVGKSTLASLCPGARFADIEGSMEDIAVPKINGVNCWKDLREWVQSLKDCIAGLDSVTRAEDWAAEHVIKYKSANDKTKATDSLEDFKYKAGLTFVNDEFKKLLSDIDAARKRKVSFIMVAHMRVNKFTNPDGSNFFRYEPRLVHDDKVSNMLAWVQFLDHCAFVDLDKIIATTGTMRGKAAGGASRTIYLDSHPSRISKCRGISNDPIVFAEGDAELWKRLRVPGA